MTKSLSTTVDANRERRIRSLLLVLDEVLQACETDLSAVLEESSKLSKPGGLPTVEKIAKAAAWLKNFELFEDSGFLKHFGWEFARLVSIFKFSWIPEGIDEEEILFWKEEINEFPVYPEDPEQASKVKEQLRFECRKHADVLRRGVQRIQTVLRQECGFNPEDLALDEPAACGPTDANGTPKIPNHSPEIEKLEEEEARPNQRDDWKLTPEEKKRKPCHGQQRNEETFVGDISGQDTLPSIEKLENDTPELDKNNSECWAKSKDLKKYKETASIDSLRSQRSRGRKSEDGHFGVCEAGRIWRKDGRDVWYYVPSLLPNRDQEQPLIAAALRLISTVD